MIEPESDLAISDDHGGGSWQQQHLRVYCHSPLFPNLRHLSASSWAALQEKLVLGNSFGVHIASFPFPIPSHSIPSPPLPPLGKGCPLQSGVSHADVIELSWHCRSCHSSQLFSFPAHFQRSFQIDSGCASSLSLSLSLSLAVWQI